MHFPAFLFIKEYEKTVCDLNFHHLKFTHWVWASLYSLKFYYCGHPDNRPEPEAQKPSYAPQPAALVVGPAKPYSFAYEVVDSAGGNAYGHRENSDGNGVTEGEYRVVLPDTRTQIVKYRVTPEAGYVAEVTYEGTAAAPL